ncbi:MAG: YihY/virulence factor BrkB family protein [Myxococcota bacterium]
MNSTIIRIKKKLSKPLAQIPVYLRWIMAIYRFFIHVFRTWKKNDSFRTSSSLAFESLFSIVPLAALSLWLVGAIGQTKHITMLTNYIGKQLFPSFGLDAVDMIRKMASRIRPEYLGTTGAVFTLLISILVFLSVEKSFNKIWGVKNKRGFFSQFSTYWTLVSLIPLMTLMLFLRRFDFPVLNSIWLSVFITIFIFFLTNKLLPNTSVKSIPALWGSLISFVLFYIAKIVVSTYFSSKYFGIYGEIGVFFLMLLWIYYLWLVIIFGATITYVFQRFTYLEYKRFVSSRWASFPGEPLSWRAWSILAFMYKNRELHDSQFLATKVVGETPAMVESLCKRMAEDNILVKVGGRWGFEYKKAEKITMARIIKLFTSPVPPEAGRATGPWLEISDYMLEIAEKINLANADNFSPEAIHNSKSDFAEHSEKQKNSSGKFLNLKDAIKKAVSKSAKKDGEIKKDKNNS